MSAVPTTDTDSPPPAITLRDLWVFAMGVLAGILLLLAILAIV